jgi:signal peptidase II
MRRPYGILLLMGLLLGLVGCDHVTKALAKSELEAQPARAVLEPVLQLRYVENTDVAFNLLRWIPLDVRGPLLIISGALAIIAVCALLLQQRVTGWRRAGLLLVLAGALGNYIDRLARGYVVDFIHVTHWPVFNVADILISVGGALLLVQALRRSPPRTLLHTGPS